MFYLGRIKKIIWRAWYRARHRATQHMKSLLAVSSGCPKCQSKWDGGAKQFFSNKEQSSSRTIFNVRICQVKTRAAFRHQELQSDCDEQLTWISLNSCACNTCVTHSSSKFPPSPTKGSVPRGCPGWKVTVTPLAQLHTEHAIPLRVSAWTSHWISFLKCAVALED